MSLNFYQTEAEREVLDSARRLLGDNLGDYLLSGLGEDKIIHRRVFTASGSSSSDEGVAYRFEVISESPEGLAIGREPLVLSVLLSMFREQWSMDDTVVFNTSEVIEWLGWPQSKESELLVKQAIDKYLKTAYCLIEPRSSEAEGTNLFHPYFERLLISYWMRPRMLLRELSGLRRHVGLKLPPGFINAIGPARKHFLGIEFNNLRELREISTEEVEG